MQQQLDSLAEQAVAAEGSQRLLKVPTFYLFFLF